MCVTGVLAAGHQNTRPLSGRAEPKGGGVDGVWTPTCWHRSHHDEFPCEALTAFTKRLGKEKGLANTCQQVLESLVPKRGLEPPRLSALVPETSASTNSATWASQERSNYTVFFAYFRKSVADIGARTRSRILAGYLSRFASAKEKGLPTFTSASPYDRGAQERTRTSTPLGAST